MSGKSKIPPGYKKTEIGIIPEDWEIKKMGEIGILKYGESRKLNPERKKVFPIIGTGGILGYGEKYICNKPSIIIGRKGTINKPIYIEHPFWCVDTTFYIEFKEKVNIKFIFYKLLLINWLNYNEASGVPSLNSKTVEKIEISIPSTLEEQRAIANVLSDFDKLIESLDKLIEKKKLIKKGAMQELLTGKKRLPGFKGEWVGKSFNYLFLNIETTKYQIKVIQYKKSGKYPVIDQGKQFIIAFTDNISKVFNPPEDGIIIFGDHTRIFKFYFKPFVVGADGVKLIYKKVEEIDMLFAYYLLSNISIPETGYNRHFKFLKELEIYFPPTLAEQRAIAQILSDMDAEIEALEKKKQKYEMMKKAAMELLLTGKIRLKEYVKGMSI